MSGGLMADDKQLTEAVKRVTQEVFQLPGVIVRPPELPSAWQAVSAADNRDVLRSTLLAHLGSPARVNSSRLAYLRTGEEAFGLRGQTLAAYAILMPWKDSPNLMTLEVGVEATVEGKAPARLRRLAAWLVEASGKASLLTQRALQDRGQHPLSGSAAVTYDLASGQFRTPSYRGPDRRLPGGRRRTLIPKGGR